MATWFLFAFYRNSSIEHVAAPSYLAFGLAMNIGAELKQRFQPASSPPRKSIIQYKGENNAEIRKVSQ
jgi:hypothetical protein